MAWVRILLLFKCFGGAPPKAFEAGDSSSRGRSARGCFASSLMDSKGNVRHFFGVRFAWHGLESCMLLFGCFGTGVQRTCANGFGTTFAATIVLGGGYNHTYKLLML